jgi:hypothetical protein
VTAPGRNGSCAVAPSGNPREILAQAIVHNVKPKTGGFTCLEKSVLTTDYLFYLRIIHQFNRRSLKSNVDRRYKEKNHQIFFPSPSRQLSRRQNKKTSAFSSYPTNQHFRAAAAYIERSPATNTSVYCYFGGISPLLNWYFSQRG